jgi:HEAT repeats
MTGNDLLRQSREAITSFDLPNPPFQFTIGLAQSHLDLLEGVFAEQGDPDLLLEAASTRGRALLHGEGGVGKTTIAKRLLIKVAEHGGFAALIDLRDWSPKLLAEWDKLRADPIVRAHLLLKRLGIPTFDEETLGTLDPDVAILIVLDGLNETPGPTAESILEVADGIASRNPQAAVIVTDRLLRRRLPSRHWQLAGVADVTVPDGSPKIDHPLARGNAFFLSLAMADGTGAPTSTAALDLYLSRHVEVTDEEIDRAAKAAADAYLESSSRTFPLERFAALAGPSATDKLLSAGLLREEHGLAIFRHHLFHDDLAARWLAAGDAHRWTATSFAALTFDANSFDVLALALARIPEQDRADRFVLSVYDYNYYGTAYALAEAAHLGEIAVDQDTHLAIISMLAERRFDSMRLTVAQVEDALRLFSDPTTVKLREASSMTKLISLVGAAEISDPHIEEWQRLFVAAPSSPAPAEAIDALTGDDPLLGWTAANVLRRTVIDPAQLEAVRTTLAEDERSVVRWRAAHALGSQEDASSVGSLLGATHDADRLVRYGAVRSLIDLAYAHRSLRDQILESLAADAQRLAADPKPSQEIERALQRVDANADWIADVTPLVEALWAAAPTIERRERWRVVARDIERAPASV